MVRPLTSCLSIAASAGLSSVVAAQSLSTNINLNAACGGGAITQNPGFGAYSFFTHGQCAAPRDPGGIASINDATNQGLISCGFMQISANSHTDFRGTRDDQGSASSSAVVTCIAHDLVFTNIANPLQTGFVDPVSVNFDFAMLSTTLGQSNCSASHPLSQTSFYLSAAGAVAAGTITHSGTGSTIDGFAVGYPGDGSLVHAVSPNSFSDLITPHDVYMQTSAQTAVVYCDHPPAAIGDARATALFALPCGTPVFNLPAGITANSQQLGIVNNIRLGAGINNQPSSITTCVSSSAGFQVQASGASLTYQWEWHNHGAATWTSVVEGANTDPAAAITTFTAVGAHGASLSLSSTVAGAFQSPRRDVRVVVSSPCGSANSSEVVWTVCLGDFNCDTTVDFFDYLDFVDAFSSQAGNSDFNADGSIDFFDYLDFVDALSAGC